MASGYNMPYSCPTESEVLATPRSQRWHVWASDAADCCRLPTDGVSCGEGIGPCCVRRRPIHRALNTSRLLPAATISSRECAGGGTAIDRLARCLVQAAAAGTAAEVSAALRR